MSGRDTLRTRLRYNGGEAQISRMNDHKLLTLKRALLYSYQSATAILSDGREFRCLINPDMIKDEYDNKYISIPFEDVCLGMAKKELNEETGEEEWVETPVPRKGTTTEGLEKIGMKAGDVFTWKETDSDWIVYLQRLEETAYFRAEIRRCQYDVDVEGKKYKIYAAQPSVTEIDWRKVDAKEWNDIDYTLNVYITKDERTDKFFHRFQVVNIAGEPWEVQGVDRTSTEGLLVMKMKEYYRNTIRDKVAEEKENNPEHINPGTDGPSDGKPFIYGDTHVLPYETHKYIVVDAGGGKWQLEDKKAKIIDENEFEVEINIQTGRSGKTTLKYIRENEEDIIFNIIIDPI